MHLSLVKTEGDGAVQANLWLFSALGSLASRLTLKRKRAQRSREREIERRSRETTFLEPLHQTPFRQIALLFTARARDSKVSPGRLYVCM